MRRPDADMRRDADPTTDGTDRGEGGDRSKGRVPGDPGVGVEAHASAHAHAHARHRWISLHGIVDGSQGLRQCRAHEDGRVRGGNGRTVVVVVVRCGRSEIGRASCRERV